MIYSANTKMEERVVSVLGHTDMNTQEGENTL